MGPVDCDKQRGNVTDCEVHVVANSPIVGVISRRADGGLPVPKIAVPEGAAPIHVRAFACRPDFLNSWADMLVTVHTKSILPWRVREATRCRLAEINHCQVCQTSRVGDLSGESSTVLPEEFYKAVNNKDASALSASEILAIDFAERFALDPDSLDEELFDRLREVFTEPEIVDLGFCVARNFAFGRLTHVLGLDDACEVNTPLQILDAAAAARSARDVRASA
jgi:alkylhydroperoxidase family enzyme